MDTTINAITPTEAEADRELISLEIIRNETALSRYPIHNLSTKDGVRIEIKRKDDHGATVLSWEVSYNSRYGPPGRLAYKLDTIIINRRLEEAGKPVPKVVRLGSLREIGVQVQAGEKNTNSVKNALLQNASAFINARINYRAVDKSERSLEAAFSRYSIIFTGELLPDGRKADAVYILLNDIYMEVLNNALMRPLDYDYLRELSPSEQRFYEIISYQIFPALKYNQRARLVYSEYCALSTQVRCVSFDHVKKQMYKVHRPHLRSGYIATVEYETTTDGDGNPDWIMHYAPGPKARNEQLAFAFPGMNARKRKEAEKRHEETTGAKSSAGANGEDAPLLLLPLPEPTRQTAAKSAPKPHRASTPAAPTPTAGLAALEPPALNIVTPALIASANAASANDAPANAASTGTAPTSAAYTVPVSGLPFDNAMSQSATPDEAAARLVRRFYETFHPSGRTSRPNSREQVQARDLLDRVGEEGAKHLVAFAHREARKTHFAIQTFGGILQYEDAATAEFAESDKKAGKARRAKARQSHQERFLGRYQAFLGILLTQGLETAFPEAYKTFSAYEQKMRRFWKERADKSEQSAEVFRHFDTPEQRVERFLTFVRDNKLAGVPDFWEWDAAHNPTPFQDGG